MNVLWMEGFEHYVLGSGSLGNANAILIEGLWTESSLSFGKVTNDIAATGNYSLNMGTLGTLRRSFGGDFEYVGTTFRWYMDKLPTLTGPWIWGQFRDVNNIAHVGIKIGTTVRISIIKDGYDASPFPHTAPSILATSSRELAPGTWNHIEIKARIHATLGYVKVRVNGHDFVSVSGVNTTGATSAGTGTAAQIGWGSFTSGSSDFAFSGALLLCIDDITALTWANDGSEDSTWLGMYGVYYLKPNSDTAIKDWTLTSGLNGYAMINDVQPDDDLNYLFATAASKKSAFNVEPLPLSIVSVAAVSPIARIKKTDSGPVDIKLGVIPVGGTADEAEAFPVTVNYTWYWDMWMTDPHTAVAWVPTQMPEIQVDRSV